MWNTKPFLKLLNWVLQKIGHYLKEKLGALFKIVIAEL